MHMATRRARERGVEGIRDRHGCVRRLCGRRLTERTSEGISLVCTACGSRFGHVRSYVASKLLCYVRGDSNGLHCRISRLGHRGRVLYTSVTCVRGANVNCKLRGTGQRGTCRRTGSEVTRLIGEATRLYTITTARC